MPNDAARFFDELERTLDSLNEDPSRDNEAMRHDLVVRPLLTSVFGLGWHSTELVSQAPIAVPQAVQESYFWTGATPKNRRPDLIIVPYGVDRTIAVVEEKKGLASISELREHLGQVKEYQYLHDAIWGLLTDGEKWILQKNLETHATFDSFAHLRRNIRELQECIGRSQVLRRLMTFGSADMVVVRPRSRLVVVASPIVPGPISSLADFLQTPSAQGLDLVGNLTQSLRDQAVNSTSGLEKDFTSLIKEGMYGEGLLDRALTVQGFGFLLLQNDYSKFDRAHVTKRCLEGVERWRTVYEALVDFYEQAMKGGSVSLGNILQFYVDTQETLFHGDTSVQCYRRIHSHPLFGKLSELSQSEVLLSCKY